MPRPAELERLIARAGFEFREVTIDAMRLLLKIEPPGLVKRTIFRAPAPLIHALRRVIPTKMYVLRKAQPNVTPPG